MDDAESHPSRGAWIEIPPKAVWRPSPRSRTPHGVRGLKCQRGEKHRRRGRSHPSRGAWIEIVTAEKVKTNAITSHPSRGAWIEIPPCRRSWI